MQFTSYVGVTGFTTKEQVDAVLRAVPPNFANGRKVMMGVLVSDKTLRGDMNKYPGRYPKPENLWNIFSNDLRALNLIHFTTEHPQRLYEDMCRVQELAGPNCHGFQLNIPWPEETALEEYRKRFLSQCIVLQCGSRAIELEGSFGSAYARLAEYEGLFETALFDRSGGRGAEIMETELDALFEQVTGKQSPFEIAVAGGLCAENLTDVLDPLSKFPRLVRQRISIDAEGKLLDVEGRLDPERAVKYLWAADVFLRNLR